ncbi:CD3324 family protein [Dethiothermospora halolimnae]|uniref:CD3324 family protein n=1 Tax=Dethiothermospora halolimnae TaxID=3114390 RepID=UPI003CCC2712
MKYINAAEVLPKNLLTEIQKHISGTTLYIPSECNNVGWGEKNGSKKYYTNRNKKIKRQYKEGYGNEEISKQYGLSYETVRKIVYRK